jgi:hypothetical protein
MKPSRPLYLGLGVLFVLVGVLWILQGLDALGQTGGMNGHPIWAVIGALAALAGLAAVVTGARMGRRP